MAMLQLGGTLSCTTVRITPRISLWVTAQHLLNVSSVAPSLDAVENTVKEEKPNIDLRKLRYTKRNFTKNESLVSAAFRNLANDDIPINKAQYNNKEHSILNSKIHSAKTVDQLLETVNNPEFKPNNASAVVHVLCNWITTGKVVMTQIENDIRYLKVCKILGIEEKSSALNEKSLANEMYKSPSYQIFQAEGISRQIENLNTSEMISLLVGLANRHKRATPALKLLARKLSNSDDVLDIKKLSDILYSMATLTFYDEALAKKTCKSLYKIVPKCESAAVIGSILTSVGILRFRDEELLDLISSWIITNKSIIRSSEISSLLMTLATIGYTPNNFNEVLERIVLPLKESDMCKSSEWLDIVWALTILNKATTQHYESVLNDSFLNRIFDTTDAIVARIVKLLNINTVAQIQEDYKGPFIPDNSSLLNTIITRPREKNELSNSVISALKLLLPVNSIYMNTNVITNMGFALDAEFCVDGNCTPLPLDSKSEKDKKVFRIAIMTCSYHEFCRNKMELIGPVKFYNKLLKSKGYTVLLIPYSDVNIRDKLVVRVKYIKDNITKLLQEVPIK